MIKPSTLLTLFYLFLLIITQPLFAIPHNDLVEVTNKRGELQLCNGDLGDIFRRYAQTAATEDIYFEDLQIIKINKGYYLLAKEQNSPKAYAFSLYRYKRALILDTSAGIRVTEKGEAALRAAILNGDGESKHLQTFTANNSHFSTAEQDTH